MQRLFLFTALAAVVPLACGCGNSGQPDRQEPRPDQSSAADQTPKSSASEVSTDFRRAVEQGRMVSQTVDAGCAKCTFNMKGVETCELAVVIDDTPYLVYGEYIDPEESGLCDGVKKAQVVGRLVEDPTGSAFDGQNVGFITESFRLRH